MSCAVQSNSLRDTVYSELKALKSVLPFVVMPAMTLLPGPVLGAGLGLSLIAGSGAALYRGVTSGSLHKGTLSTIRAAQFFFLGQSALNFASAKLLASLVPWWLFACPYVRPLSPLNPAMAGLVQLGSACLMELFHQALSKR